MPHPLTIAVLQLRAFDLADHEQAWTELLRRIDDAAAETPRLIVAPEAAYPAAILDTRGTSRTALHGDAEVLAILGDRARRHSCYIAVGLVLHDPSGAPQNAAVLIAPGGAVIARATERHPSPWFAAGSGPVTALVDDVRVALFAGRDAEDAGEATSVAEDRARLLISSRAATTWGRGLHRLPEPAAHVLLAARALECGAWIAVPTKVGTEASSRVYSGRAGVVAPTGAWVVRAPSDRPGIVLHTLDLDAAPGPPTSVASSAPLPRAEATRVAVVSVARTPSAVDLMERLRALVRAASAQGATFVVLPDLAGTETRAVTSDETRPLIEALSAETGTILAVALAERVGGQTFKTAYLIDRGTLLASHRQSVLHAAERAAGFSPGTTPPPVVATSVGRIGLLCGVEGLVPPLAAGIVERGGTLIAWCAGDAGGPVETLARARTMETERFVVAAGIASASGGGCIVDTRGAILATTLDGEAMTAFADLPVTRG